MMREKLGKGLMELVGTAMLVMTIQVSVASGSDLAPLAIGGVLMALIYAGGSISGAHYNPAVSLASFLRNNGEMSMLSTLMYWAFQLVGGWLGAVLGGSLNGGSYASISIGKGATTKQALLAEVVFTFLLCFVFLGVATHTSVSNNHFFGFSIGMVVLVGAIAVGPISGGAFNPAVALGLAMAKGSGSLNSYVLSVAGVNLVGGMIAAGIFYLVAPDQFDLSSYARIP